MLKKYPFLPILLFLYLSAFSSLFFSVLNSFVFTKLLISGTKVSFVKNNFLQENFDSGIKTSSLLFRGVIYEVMYSDQISDGSEIFTRLDYRLAKIRKIIFELYLPTMFSLVLITIFWFSNPNKIYSQVLSGIGILISAYCLNFIIYEQFTSAAMFYPKTVEFFYPLKIRPDHDTYFSNGIVVMATITIFTLLFFASFHSDWQNKSKSIFFPQ